MLLLLLADWSSLDASPPPGFSFGSDCYCKNVVCPCETLGMLVAAFIRETENIDHKSD